MTTQSHSPIAARRLGAADAPYTPPFSVQDSCLLSEDYFLTSQLIVNDGDLIRPFLRADGTVEALVLSGGNLSWLHRDPQATSGWSYVPLSTDPNMVVPGEVSDVAVGTDSDGNVMGVCVAPNTGDPSQPYLLCPLQLLDPSSDTPWYSDPDAAWPLGGGLSPFRNGTDPVTGSPYFYASDASGQFTITGPVQDTPVQMSGPALSGVTDGWLLWASSGWNSDEAWAAGIVVTGAAGTFTWYQQDGSYAVSTEGCPLQGQGRLLWVGWPPSGVAGLDWSSPGYAYQDPSGDIWWARPGADYVGPNGIGSTQAELGPDTVAVWQDGGLFSFAMLFGNAVNVVTQYGDPAAYPPALAGPIPLQPGVMQVFSAPADPAQGTLFVVLADATLAVLAKDPAAGWSLVPVQQDVATLQELDCWRVQLSVTDANGVAVAGALVSVSADRQAGTWQASGSTVLGPASPATFTADARGRVTFATPAVELDAPQLSVQVVSGDDAIGPVTVSPDADVQAFLGGAAPLNDLGSLTGASLLAAKKADGTPLCPVLASAPSDQQAQAATGVVNAIAQCVKAGQGVTPGPDDVKSFVLDLSGDVPAYASSTQPGGVQVPPLIGADQLGSLSSWWDSVKNDADSFFHGVRHDAVQIATCTANWVQDEATGAWHWAVSLAVTVENEIIGAADYVITDIRSAIHAVTGFFAKLGAAIGDAITWLRQNVGELIAEAGQNARQIEAWLDQLPGIVTSQLTGYGQIADGFFAALETAIDEKIDTIVLPGLGHKTFGSPAPDTPPAVFDVQKFLSGAQHNWLLDKIESFFSGDTPVQVNTDLQAAFGQLAVAAQDGMQAVTDIGELLWTGLQAPFASSDSAGQTQLANFVGLLQQAVHDLLAFADAIVQVLIDLAKAAMDQLGDMLAHGFEDIPLVSKLLAHFGVDTTMNVAHLVSLVLMYPATLANRIANGAGSTLFPAVTAGQDGERVGDAQQDWAFGLGLSSAIGQGIWGVADAVGDTQVAVLGQKEQSGIIGWIDIASPLVLAILEWPGTPAGPPFANPIDGSGPDGAMIWPNWLLGLVPPIAGLCGQFAGDQKEFPVIGPYFTMAAAIASTILGSIYNVQTGQNAETVAAGIVSNVSNVIAPFATEELTDATEGGSLIVKLLIDYFCNLGAAGLMGAALDA